MPKWWNIWAYCWGRYEVFVPGNLGKKHEQQSCLKETSYWTTRSQIAFSKFLFYRHHDFFLAFLPFSPVIHNNYLSSNNFWFFFLNPSDYKTINWSFSFTFHFKKWKQKKKWKQLHISLFFRIKCGFQGKMHLKCIPCVHIATRLMIERYC